MCEATQDAQTRERNGAENEPRFLCSSKIHRSMPLKESAVQINIARKRHPKKSSIKNLDGL